MRVNLIEGVFWLAESLSITSSPNHVLNKFETQDYPPGKVLFAWHLFSNLQPEKEKDHKIILDLSKSDDGYRTQLYGLIIQNGYFNAEPNEDQSIFLFF
jgi:hypothetical protein